MSGHILSPVDTMRHSCAHLMAAAIAELYPGAKFGVGPVVEHGFYYDVDIAARLAPADLKRIEKKMREIQKRHDAFVRRDMPIDEAIAFFQERGQTYKVDLLTDLKTRGTTAVHAEESFDVDPQGSTTVSVYETGSFVDLCRGPHVENTKEIGAYQLTKVAGAYWRGKEENPMLQRIYGLCFASQPELDQHVAMVAEAEKRDHRKLGRDLDLFTFSELVGPGLPLWTPRGTLVRALLDEFVWSLRRARGYVRVEIPHITKKDLYERSGHWEKFKDELFRVTTREGHEFAMKPMNCPHHTQIYDRKKWSYRELPQRYANTTVCYRDEQSGELSGLSRVRAFAQDDAHVFCRVSQMRQEVANIWDIINEFYATFGFALRVRLSLHDPAKPEAYLGDTARWGMAEAELRDIVEEKGMAYVEAIGEAAFYGPKLDFMAKDSLGREWQVATIQLDMNMPERFDLSCTNEAGEPERIVMIHAAIMGSIERFLSVAIEHTAGNFPVWLAPVQAVLVPVGESHIAAAQSLAGQLAERGMRVEVDESSETVGKKIRRSELARIPYALVLGDKEVPANAAWDERTLLSIRVRGQEALLTTELEGFARRVEEESVTRRDIPRS